MKKLFLIIAIILVVATGCKDRNANITSAPTSVPTGDVAKPTENTLTPTATPTSTPTATPTLKPTATPTARPTATPSVFALSLNVCMVDEDGDDTFLIDDSAFERGEKATKVFYIINGKSVKVRFEGRPGENRKCIGWYEDEACTKLLSSDPVYNLELTPELGKLGEKNIYVRFSPDYTLTVADADITELQKFVGTTALADTYKKICDLGYRLGFALELDENSAEPWGTILKIEKSSDDIGELFKITASGNERDGVGYEYAYGYAKEYSADDLKKYTLVKDYSADELNKGKIEAVTIGQIYEDKFTRVQEKEEYPLYTNEYLSWVIEDKVLDGCNFYDDEYNENGDLIRRIKYYDNNECVIEEVTYLEKKEYVDKYGLSKVGIAKFRVDFYSATKGKSSDEKELITYAIFEQITDEKCLKSDWELLEYGRDRENSFLFGESYSMYDFSGKLFRADGTLQSTIDGGVCSITGTAGGWSYDVNAYDENEKQINEACCDEAGGVDFVIEFDRYGQATIDYPVYE